MIKSYLHIYIHDKFLKPGIQIPDVIPDLLTKWHIQIHLGLHVVLFFSSAMI
jgi:hypothetical protein